MPQKIEAATIYRAFTVTIFRYFFVFTITRGGSEFNKFCENCEESRLQRFFALNCFSLLFGLSHLPDRLRNSTNYAKIAKNCGCSDLLHFKIFRYFFVNCSHLTQSAFEFIIITRKVRKIVPLPQLNHFSFRLHHLAERSM